MRTWIAGIALLLVAAGLAPALEAKPARKAAASAWDSRFARSPSGDTIMGRPDAPIKLVEYISFTCSHCAEFNATAKAELRDQMVRKGQVSIELRPIMRIGAKVDMVGSLLALCGPISRHFGNTDAILASQALWLNRLEDPALHARWDALPPGMYVPTVAKELGLYAVMQKRGYSNAQIDACLADRDKAQHVIDTSNYAFQVLGLSGTPTFLVNDSIVSVYDWYSLKGILLSMLPQ